jgi:hypothetical protein
LATSSTSSLTSVYDYGWPEQHDEDAPDAMRVEAFRGVLGEFVACVCEKSEAHPAPVLAQTLAMTGCAVGRGPHIMIGPGDFHRPKLFVLTIGKSARARKGTSLKAPTMLMERVDPTLRHVRDLSSGEAAIDLFRDESIEVDPDTNEETVTHPGAEDKRAVIVLEEYGGLLRKAKGQTNTLFANLRLLWDDNRIENVTRGGGRITASDHVAATLNHIVKDELVDLTSAGTELSNGFMNRHLFVYSGKTSPKPFGQDLSPLMWEHFVNEFRQSIRFGSVMGAYPLAADARVLWNEDLYPRLWAAEYEGIVDAVTTRGAAYVLRMAMVYAILDRAKLIQPEHLIAAEAVWDYSVATAHWVWGDISTNKVLTDVWNTLRGLGGQGIKRWDLHEQVGKHHGKKRFGEALDHLESVGFALRTKEPTGGRPAELWMANVQRLNERRVPARRTAR